MPKWLRELPCARLPIDGRENRRTRRSYGISEPSYEEAEAFLKQREELEKATTEYIFEKGDYVIYKLSEVAV